MTTNGKHAADASRDDAGFLRKLIICSRGMRDIDRRNARRTNGWLLGWMVVFVATTFALKSGALSGLPAWLAIAAATALGIVAILRYIRFLREADELLRKIQLEAIALGFGAGLVAHFTGSLVARLLNKPLDAGDVLLVMVIGYILGVILGTRRYA
ncbi:MAG: hypothetical protein PVG42_16690 [Lysobacterales bacterium]|jgi:hypothetical protein